jgi:hypothetical protein
MGNHPGDRHVLAAAVSAGATIIVTSNVRHFPARALRPHGVAARTPDQFLGDLLAADPAGMRALLVAQGAELHRARTLDEVLDGSIVLCSGGRGSNWPGADLHEVRYAVRKSPPE